VIDPEKGEIAATIPIEGKLEGLAFDGRERLFINTEGKSMIQVIDTHSLKLVAAWPIAPVEGGTGLTIDAAHHRLFSRPAATRSSGGGQRHGRRRRHSRDRSQSRWRRLRSIERPHLHVEHGRHRDRDP
jgi:hypothetical protein